MLGAQGVIIVYDISNKNSFSRVDFWLSNVRDAIKSSKVVIALCANKADLEKVRNVSSEEGKSKAAQEAIQYHETSAMTGSGVTDMMDSVLDSIGSILYVVILA